MVMVTGDVDVCPNDFDNDLDDDFDDVDDVHECDVCIF